MSRKTDKPAKLNKTERTILSTAASTGGRITLAELTTAFRRIAAANRPVRWHYATKVEPTERTEWLASLRARNGIRKPVRLGLLRKVKPGTYALTNRGRAAVTGPSAKAV